MRPAACPVRPLGLIARLLARRGAACIVAGLGSRYADSGHRCHWLCGIAAGHGAAGETEPGRGRHLGGFVPADETLSEHLVSRAEVAEALTIQDGPELVWLGAAMIIGAGSTSFETMRYVGDRFPLMPGPSWMDNPIDPISIRDVLHYLVAAADPDRVPAGAYDISGPTTTSYRELLKTYARADPHHLANTDPVWAGGDALRIGRLARAIPPSIARPTLKLVNSVPGPLAGALRTGLDILITLTPKVRPA